jgi:V/A-type H+-transporting ATPase subunit K
MANNTHEYEARLVWTGNTGRGTADYSSYGRGYRIAIAEKPESFGRSLIFVGLSEGIAIYGLLISFLVLPR